MERNEWDELEELDEKTCLLFLEKRDQDVALFLYSPLCGTCQLAERLLLLTKKALPQLKVYKLNLNQSRVISKKYHITSIPCLLKLEEGKLHKKLAIHSVSDLYTWLKPLVR